MQIDAVKIPGLIKFNKLVHGISPRLCLTEDKNKTELNLNPKANDWHRNSFWKDFLSSLGASQQEPFFLNQVHGDQIYCIDEINHSLIGGVLMGDAIISNLPNKNIAVFTADCLPVITYDIHLNIVGVIHAGRKGTSLGITRKTIQKMVKKYGSSPQNIVVGFGPGVGGCCYEVGYECLDSFRDSYSSIEPFAVAKENKKYMLDLKIANRLNALDEGILEENIFDCDICTVCNNDLVFSYRKMDAGRTMTIVMLLP
jgi:polyphenol oxidase